MGELECVGDPNTEYWRPQGVSSLLLARQYCQLCVYIGESGEGMMKTGNLKLDRLVISPPTTLG